MDDKTNDKIKADPAGNFSDPKKIGIAALLSGVLSLFIFGAGLSLVAIVYGSYGIYASLKKKHGVGVIVLNVCAVVLGVASRILLEIVKHRT